MKKTLPTTTAQPVTIPDSKLRAAIEAALGKASGARITEADMQTLTELEVERVGYSRSNRASVRYKSDKIGSPVPIDISDVSPLAGLINLRRLHLGRQRYIGCLTPRQTYKSDTLEISTDNQLSDVAPLAKLTNLTHLSLWWQRYIGCRTPRKTYKSDTRCFSLTISYQMSRLSPNLQI